MLNKIIQKIKTPLSDGSSSPRNELLQELQNVGFNPKKLKQILDNGKFDINQKDENSQTLLHVFAKQNNGEAIMWLIKNGADVSLQNAKNQTPLHIAVLSNAKFAVMALLNSGINIDIVNSNGKTIFQELIALATPVVAELLIVKSQNPNFVNADGQNVLFDAVINGSLEIISMIAKNFKIEKNLFDNNGNTVLHLSQSINNPQIGVKLIENGANPTILNRSGKNYFYYVLSGGSQFFEIFKVSKNLGFDLNSKILGQNLIHHIVNLMDNICEHDKQKCQDLAKLMISLINISVDVNAKNQYGETPLIVAAKSSNLAAFGMLIKLSNISVAAVDDDGMSALHYISMQKNSLSFVELLLAKGAKTEACLESKTPLHFAVSVDGDKNVVARFLQIKDMAFALDSKGRNILHTLAITNENLEYYEMIMKDFSSLAYAYDIYGILPIEYAILKGRFELASKMARLNPKPTPRKNIKKSFVLVDLEIFDVDVIVGKISVQNDLAFLADSMREDFCDTI